MADAASYSVVVPTVGRPQLGDLLRSLALSEGPPPREVVVVDDRTAQHSLLDLPPEATGSLGSLPIKVVSSGGRGPAAARNCGWRATSSDWVAFLDDDVLLGCSWKSQLERDLSDQPWQIAGSQARLEVPLPSSRKPTDWERNTALLAGARWATADLSYRRDVLQELGGFDERFPRAFREDADLGLRVHNAGYLIVRGERRTEHPVRPTGRWASLRCQAGNADDVLMRALHGPGWRVLAGAGPSRNWRHLATTLAGISSLVGLVSPALGRSGLGPRRRTAGLGAIAWLAGTAEFAARRILPGPRSANEVANMVMTSILIPPAAVIALLRGWARLPSALRDSERAPNGLARSPLALRPPAVLAPPKRRPRPGKVDVNWHLGAVLFDRDGTLIVNCPGNKSPDLVVPMPGARAALRHLRDEGVPVGVVSNQSAVGRGDLALEELAAINRRTEELLGPFDTWQICTHHPDERCQCRKPAPGLIASAANDLGLSAESCAVIGDTKGDIDAAASAGGRAVLVPTRATRPTEIADAPVVAADIIHAVDLVLGKMCQATF